MSPFFAFFFQSFEARGAELIRTPESGSLDDDRLVLWNTVEGL